MVNVMERLPFFVYGTLIPNQPNYYLWKDSITDTKTGIIRNYQLFDMGHYPMIVESEGNNVEGMIVYIKTEDYSKITKIIDNLEGYTPENHGNCAYNREIKNIELERRDSVSMQYRNFAFLLGRSGSIGSSYLKDNFYK